MKGFDIIVLGLIIILFLTFIKNKDNIEIIEEEVIIEEKVVKPVDLKQEKEIIPQKPVPKKKTKKVSKKMSIPMKLYKNIGIKINIQIDDDDTIEVVLDTGSQYLFVFQDDCSGCSKTLDTFEGSELESLGEWKNNYAKQTNFSNFFSGDLMLGNNKYYVMYGSVYKVQSGGENAPFMGLIYNHQVVSSYRVSLLKQLRIYKAMNFDFENMVFTLYENYKPKGHAFDLYETKDMNIGFYTLLGTDENDIDYNCILDIGFTGTGSTTSHIPREITISNKNIDLKLKPSSHIPNYSMTRVRNPFHNGKETIIIGLTWLINHNFTIDFIDNKVYFTA
tara:strand:- start:1033 stop:2034 length:1002 start_codon:yes stop_codon:yes gene_type:complete